MAGPHRFRFAYLLGSLLLLVASLHPPTAYSALGDPPSGSPAGAVYELPLEQGRADAAPRPPASSTDAAGERGGTSSHYRSENNFGSSSRIPGLVAASGAGGLAVVGAGGGRGGAGGDLRSGGDRAGGGSGVEGAVAGQVADAGNTSIASSVLLLGVIGLLAAGVGAMSRRFR